MDSDSSSSSMEQSFLEGLAGKTALGDCENSAFGAK